MNLRRFTAVVLVAVLSIPAVFATQAKAPDVSGIWTGSFQISVDGGAPRDDTAYIVLKQKAEEISGSAGPSAEKQDPITKGKVVTKDGVTMVIFELLADGRVSANFELKLVEGHLKGTAKAAEDGRSMVATIDVVRQK